jgi:hypothetical protein
MTTAATQRSELAHRSTAGIQVWLFWSQPSNRITIELIDNRIGERLEFEVANDKALDAFRHPYAYAPAQALDLAETKTAVRR